MKNIIERIVGGGENCPLSPQGRFNAPRRRSVVPRKGGYE